MPIKTNIKEVPVLYTADFKAANKRVAQPKSLAETQQIAI
jgi:hypothetical protein